MKGRIAVKRAIEFLTDLGFTCSDAQDESANGHDVVAIKRGRGYTFEVKPAIFKQRSYRISKVSKITSDGIILVFPSGAVFVDSMKNHLESCSKTGVRFMTFVGHIYE